MNDTHTRIIKYGQCDQNKAEDTLKTGFNLFVFSQQAVRFPSLWRRLSPQKKKVLLRKDVTPIPGAYQTKYLEVNLDHTLKFLFDCILGARIDHFTFQRC